MTNDNEHEVPKATSDEMMSDAERQAQAINQQNETEDINKMVDEDLLTTEEASTFSHGQELEIPPTFLKNSPKISERLRRHIVSKFTREEFFSDHAASDVHGTGFDALYPLFMGTGERKTGQYGVYENPNMSRPTRHMKHKSINKPKKTFEIIGEFDMTGDGFGPDPKTGQRHISESTFPIYLKAKTFEGVELAAIVLSKWDNRSIDGKIASLEKDIQGMQKGQHYQENINFLFYDLSRKARKQVWANESINEIVNQLTAEILLENELTQDEKGVSTGPQPKWNAFMSRNEETKYDLWFRANWKNRAKEHIIQLREEVNSPDEETSEIAKNKFTQILFRKLKNSLTKEEVVERIQKHISYLYDLKSRHEGEELFDWAMRQSDHERIFSVRQMANYAANVMARGVDNSKIVPIYDWDGNLLWPKDNDTIDSTEHENEEE